MSDWVSQITNSLSYRSVAALMFLENIFPPIPSEVVMPAAGFSARQGEQSFVGLVLAGTVGSLAGALPWYYAGRWLGKDRFVGFVDRHGKWLAVSKSETRRAMRWFDYSGKWAVLFCRMIPGVRTLISVPAGFVAMPLGQFLLFSAIGTLGWNVALASLGWWLQDNYRTVGDYVTWITVGIVAAIVLWWLVRLSRRRGWFGHRSESTG